MQPHDPTADRTLLRQKLIAARESLPDRLERAVELQSVLRAWLVGHKFSTIGAYWPIKGEFDPLPALYRWSEAAEEPEERIIGLPVADRATESLQFHMWFPGCPMEPDAYDIPKPKGTPVFRPELLLLPCLGYGAGGVRMGYGGGFYRRTIEGLSPRPVTVGLGYSSGFLPLLRQGPQDLLLDAMLTEDGVMWHRP
jgi:5,10-methenyltetrahydrofolate synthetase